MEYELIRSQRKSVSLIVKNGKLTVRAPKKTSISYIESFISERLAWIERNIEATKIKPLSYQTGDTLTLYGRQYLICEGRGRICGDILYLPQKGRETAFKRILCALTQEVMGELTERISKRYSIPYERVKVSPARRKWGSCSRDRVIAYSFRLSLAPYALCEYVAVHELCHIYELNHSSAFWKNVEAIMPDWKARRKQLKSLSYLMNSLPF